MARLVLDFPSDVFCFATQLTVRTTDINAANHLGNDSMVSMISEARALFLHEFDVDEAAASAAAGGANGSDGARLGIIVTDLATTYKNEAHARDHLWFDVGVMDFNKYGGDIVFRVHRPLDGALIAMAKYGFVFFDYAAGKVAPMPPAFRAKFPNVNSL
jgi:acyl-CoA thioesterase FadM